MRPASFELTRPESISEALTMIEQGGAVIAGGQSLLQSLRLRDSTPPQIIDVGQIPECQKDIDVHDQYIRLGAVTTHRALAEHNTVAEEFPWLCESSNAIGDVQVRNLGTTLGNVCWADPRANMAIALLASGATVEVARRDEVELIAIEDFYTGFRQTRTSNALSLALRVPRIPGARGKYLEFSRQPQDLALVNVCVVSNANKFSVAVGGVDHTPVRVAEVEAALSDGVALEAAFDREAEARQFSPPADQFGSAAYKLGLAKTLIVRAAAALQGESA